MSYIPTPGEIKGNNDRNRHEQAVKSLKEQLIKALQQSKFEVTINCTYDEAVIDEVKVEFRKSGWRLEKTCQARSDTSFKITQL